mmetsp:Transcript_9606/g.22781  ORF Transcript_9606/g.22781 Transcript_9606/m.22781 type:complete len:200 (+) Transcript_9606:1-600(+)
MDSQIYRSQAARPLLGMVLAHELSSSRQFEERNVQAGSMVPPGAFLRVAVSAQPPVGIVCAFQMEGCRSVRPIVVDVLPASLIPPTSDRITLLREAVDHQLLVDVRAARRLGDFVHRVVNFNAVHFAPVNVVAGKPQHFLVVSHRFSGAGCPRVGVIVVGLPGLRLGEIGHMRLGKDVSSHETAHKERKRHFYRHANGL